MAFFSPPLPLHAAYPWSSKRSKGKSTGEVARSGDSPPLHTSEKRKTVGRKVFGRGYEFTDSVERGLLFARGCGGFRQKPHAYLSFSLLLSLSSTFNAASPFPLGCVMEIAFARRERGGLGLFYNPTAEVRRNYYWANCILTNSKGVRV